MWLPEEVGTSEEKSKEGQTIPVFSPFFFLFRFHQCSPHLGGSLSTIAFV